MSRAAYNRLATVRFGPGTPTPGVIKAFIQCRYVTQDRVLFQPGAFFLCDHYITTDYANLSAGSFTTVGGNLILNIPTADTIDIPAIGVVARPVRLVQVIHPYGGATYYRATLF